MIRESEGDLAVTPESSDNPPVALKPLLIIIDLALHAKLIFAGLKSEGKRFEPGGLVLRPGFEPGSPAFFTRGVERPEYLTGLYYRSIVFP